MPLGEDADNVRVDGVGNQVIVAYSGGLAVVDPASRSKVNVLSEEVSRLAINVSYRTHDRRVFLAVGLGGYRNIRRK